MREIILTGMEKNMINRLAGEKSYKSLLHKRKRKVSLDFYYSVRVELSYPYPAGIYATLRAPSACGDEDTCGLRITFATEVLKAKVQHRIDSDAGLDYFLR